MRAKKERERKREKKGRTRGEAIKDLYFFQNPTYFPRLLVSFPSHPSIDKQIRVTLTRLNKLSSRTFDRLPVKVHT